MTGARRALTEGERTLVREAFGDRVDFGRVRISAGAGGNPCAWLGLKTPNTDGITLIRTIFFKEPAIADYSKTGDKYLFLHEMTHIWQYQTLGAVGFGLRYARDFISCRGNRKAMYAYEQGDLFGSARLEAQADMIRDYAVGGARRAKAAPGLAKTGMYGL